MSFVVLPPEINSLRMFIGAGTAPMLAAAAAWDGLAEELGTAAQSFASVTAGLAGQAWQGPAALAMAAAAAPYAGWLTAAAAQSAGAAGQARAQWPASSRRRRRRRCFRRRWPPTATHSCSW